MSYYCNRCKKAHSDNELCPRFKMQIKQHPELLSEAVDFASIAGQYKLVSANLISKILPYEGTHQTARDVEVFKRLNDEFFVRSGHFSSPERAKLYYDYATNNPSVMDKLNCKLTGASQEVDWLIMKKGEINSLWEKSYLLNKNAPGVDGETISRITGEQINRTTIKGSANPIDMDNLTGPNGVAEAIEKGYATPNDIIFGNKGMKKTAREIGLKNPVIEKGTAKDVRESNQRLRDKIMRGEATTTITAETVGKKAMQGAVIGAALNFTISSLTTYLRYRNGELTIEEAFTDIGEETVKGALVGGALSATSLFLPPGVLGFAGNVAIGVYVGEVSKNLLDEVFGKGAYGEILNASGCTMVSCLNFKEGIVELQNLSYDIDNVRHHIKDKLKKLNKDLNEFDRMKENYDE